MKIYSVSEITRGIKILLEENYSDVWIEGEISNFKPAGSGHFYFSLKDDQSQIRSVMFRGSNQNLKFRPENGLQVLAYGRVTVYEPRGEYQIIVEHLEPKGAGALQLAFEQLKKKLEAEGLFNADRKRPIPFLPSKIGIITSPTGAVIRDMIHVLTRRFPNVQILLHPVPVQGEGAAEEIAGAIGLMAARDDLEVLIVARGGGSVEDLWAFNEEAVARAIAASRVPVISAVGHETDFTIADFVADLRAPTPSAAAELAVPVLEDLLETIGQKRRRLYQAIDQQIENSRLLLRRWEAFFRDPGRRVTELLLRLDHLRERLTGQAEHRIEMLAERLKGIRKHLDSLNPLAILGRGYAVVTAGDGDLPLRRPSDVEDGQGLKIRLYEGNLSAVASVPRGPQTRKI
jgi:exodeoxyribonuclease VII large subunit